MSKSGKSIGVVVVVVLLPILLIVMVWATDVFLSIRAVSTKEAPGFSEEKFKLITINMTSQSVIAILGKPLLEESKPPNLIEWWYTQPKEPLDGWGTWDARMLLLSNDIVIETMSQSVLNH